MNNHDRLSRALNRGKADRILTWDFVDNEGILETNARAFGKIGLYTTRYMYGPVNHRMGSKIVNWIRFFGVNPDNWEVKQAGDTAWISKRPFKTLRELVSHIMDCTGTFSASISRVYAENPSAPLLFMGEDICGSAGPTAGDLVKAAHAHADPLHIGKNQP